MATVKVIVLAACVSVCTCVTYQAIPVLIVPALPPQYTHYVAAAEADATANSSKADAAALVHADPLVTTVYNTHKAFLDHLQAGVPYHYSYGYELHNWKTGLTISHYESRYTDVGVGTYTQLASGAGRVTVDYTIDTDNGFHGVVHRDHEGRETQYGYASRAGQKAYDAHLALQAQELRTEQKGGDHPLANHAFQIHEKIIGYFNLQPPYRYSWGYQVTDPKTGQTRSQFESAYGNTSEGAFALIEKDGQINSIDYNIDEKGIITFASPI